MPEQRRCYFDVSEAQQGRNRRELRKLLRQMEVKAHSMGLSIDNLTFKRKSFNEKEYNLMPKHFHDKLVERKHDITFKAQRTRDICHLSKRKYFLLRESLGLKKELPSQGKCDVVKKMLDNYFELEENETGFYLKEPEKKIRLAILDYYNNNLFAKGDKIMIKIACDGTNVTSKSMKQVNLTFTLIDDKENATAVKGNFVLGMFKSQKEDYETLKESLWDIFQKLEKIKSIEINGQMVEIEQFMGGDMKCLAILYGINAANSIQPCVWCEWSRSTRVDLNANYRKRTLSLARESIGTNGYCKIPISYIDFDHVSIDMLHLFIRIAEKLCNLIENYIGQYEEQIEVKVEKQMQKWIDFWMKECNITNAFMLNSNNVMARRGSMTGSEYVKFFELISKSESTNIILRLKFDSNQTRNETLKIEFDYLFRKFYELITIIKAFSHDKYDLNGLKYHLREWLQRYVQLINPSKKMLTNEDMKAITKMKNSNNSKFVSISHVLSDDQINLLDNVNTIEKFLQSLEEDQILIINDILSTQVPITPYIHAFVFHVPEFLQTYGNVNIFNTQGLEKLNDLTTIYFHTSTNKKIKDKMYLRQIMEKRNRVEFYTLGLTLTELNMRKLTSGSSNQL